MLAIMRKTNNLFSMHKKIYKFKQNKPKIK